MESLNFLDYQINHIGQTILMYPMPECPVGCSYCFEADFFAKKEGYNRELIAESLKKIMEQRGQKEGDYKKNTNNYNQPGHIILHGGEVLTLPIKDFEFFIKLMLKYQPQPAIQTSLFGMTDKHVRLIKKYNVSVGVSLDGPAELNILRGPRDPERNKKYQIEAARNLDILRNDEKLQCGTVTVINKANAGNFSKLEKLVEWSRTKTDGGRFNAMFVPNFIENHPIGQYALSPDELTNAFLYMLNASFEYQDFRPSFVQEMSDNLLGMGLQSCQFSRCDYLTTKCVTIMPNGLLARCDRCFQDGYYYASTTLGETQQRAFILGQTECLDPNSKHSPILGECAPEEKFLCRYWNVCGGGCPGENADYRHKTNNCKMYYTVYSKLEGILRKLYPEVTLAIDLPPDYYYMYPSQGKYLNPDIQRSRMNHYGMRMTETEAATCNNSENLQKEARKRGVNHLDEYTNRL